MVILLKTYKWTSIRSKISNIEKQEIPPIVVQYSEFSQNCSWYPVPTALHLLKSSNFTLQMVHMIQWGVSCHITRLRWRRLNTLLYESIKSITCLGITHTTPKAISAKDHHSWVIGQWRSRCYMIHRRTCSWYIYWQSPISP